MFIKKEYKKPNCRNLQRRQSKQTGWSSAAHSCYYNYNYRSRSTCVSTGSTATGVFCVRSEVTCGFLHLFSTEVTRRQQEHDKPSRKLKIWASFCSTSRRKKKLLQKSTGREEKQQSCTQERIPRIAHVLLDSSGSVEYPDWTKEDREDTKTASVRELQVRVDTRRRVGNLSLRSEY